MNAKKNKNLALKFGIQTYQILTNDNEVYTSSLSSILLAVRRITNVLKIKGSDKRGQDIKKNLIHF